LASVVTVDSSTCTGRKRLSGVPDSGGAARSWLGTARAGARKGGARHREAAEQSGSSSEEGWAGRWRWQGT
jgi:hypothetical protein